MILLIRLFQLVVLAVAVFMAVQSWLAYADGNHDATLLYMWMSVWSLLYFVYLYLDTEPRKWEKKC